MDYSLPEDDIADFRQYWDSVYKEAITKLQGGAKRIIIALPVGGGKTTMLTRIAKSLCNDGSKQVVFIVSMKGLALQLKHLLADDLPQMTIVPFYSLKAHGYEELTNADVILVDTLRISDRRELTIRLKDFPGIIITACNVPFGSQEVSHE